MTDTMLAVKSVIDNSGNCVKTSPFPCRDCLIYDSCWYGGERMMERLNAAKKVYLTYLLGKLDE